MGLCGISLRVLKKEDFYFRDDSDASDCFKTGLQSDLKFIIPPISSSDD